MIEGPERTRDLCQTRGVVGVLRPVDRRDRESPVGETELFDQYRGLTGHGIAHLKEHISHHIPNQH